MTIKTIIFDFGGVIYMTPNLQWLNRWKRVLGFDDDPRIVEMLANPNESQLVREICLGKIPEDQIWVMMAEKWHIKPDLIGRLRRHVFSKRHLNKTMVKFLMALHKDYQTAILSNAGNQARRLMEGTFHLDRCVEDIIILAEEGLIKPDHEIFQITMDRLGAEPETTLLLDDYLENVLAARDFGMKAVQFINNQQAIQTIRDYLDEEV
jgi:epoxide hydrolase-like predicted phosphatase